MDYLVHFEDGSSAYLVHHGVKGQKWGVWNDETARRYKGGSQRAAYFKKAVEAGSKLGNEAYAKYGSDSEKATAYILSHPQSAKSSGTSGEFLRDTALETYNHKVDPRIPDPKKYYLSKADMLSNNGDAVGSTLFVSGSSKTQSKESGYYRRNLPREVRKELKDSMRKGDKIIVGDAPGIDRQVQDYLNKKRYPKVEIYSPGTEARYKAGKDWVNHLVNDTKHEPGSKEWLAKKDEAMTGASTKGLAVILDEGANATRRNVQRMSSQSKETKVYELSKKGKRKDRWVSSNSVRPL